MGNIDWIPIAEMPEEMKDGRAVLLAGGHFDDHSDESPESDRTRRPVSAWWDLAGVVEIGVEQTYWRYCSYDSGFYGSYYHPTHYAEINQPLP